MPDDATTTERLLRATAVDIDLGRRALRRRGIALIETDEPILGHDRRTDHAGVFDPSTAEVTVAPRFAAQTTYHRLGMYAEIFRMKRSDNPRTVASVRRIIALAGEDRLAEVAAMVSIDQSSTNQFFRIVRDNLAWLRFTTSHAGTKEIECAARLLALAFDKGTDAIVPHPESRDLRYAPVCRSGPQLFENDRAE